MNICSECQRPVGSCSWERSFRPVDGWTAEKATRRFQSTLGGKSFVTQVETFSIKECPLYIPPAAGRERDRDCSKPTVKRFVVAEDMVFHTKVKFPSAAAADRDGGFIKAEVVACLEGRQRSHYGHYFYWEEVEED